jgi:hypothetical protein
MSKAFIQSDALTVESLNRSAGRLRFPFTSSRPQFSAKADRGSDASANFALFHIAK